MVLAPLKQPHSTTAPFRDLGTRRMSSTNMRCCRHVEIDLTLLLFRMILLANLSFCSRPTPYSCPASLATNLVIMYPLASKEWNLPTRLSALPKSGSPLPIIDAAYRSHRRHGEWYEKCPTIQSVARAGAANARIAFRALGVMQVL